MYATAMEPIPHEPAAPHRPPDASGSPVIPLPPVLDTPAVVLVGMLLGFGCDVVLDASPVHTVESEAADALARLLGRRGRAGGRVVLCGAAPAVRKRLERHGLSASLVAPAVVARDEAALTCPFLDATGFIPSLR